MRALRFAPWLVVLAGCGDALDRFQEVKDLRILAIQADPPEIFVDPEDPADNSVTFRALVVDPRGGEMSYTWRFCPVQSSRACRDYARVTDGLSSDLRASLDAIYNTTLEGVAPDPQAPDAPIAAFDVPSFSFTPTLPFFLYHAQDNIFGMLEGAWPPVVLEVATPDGETLLGQKRLVVNVRNPAAFAGEAAAELGVTLCPPDHDPAQPADCVYLPERRANRNPEFSGVKLSYARPAEADTFLPYSGLPEVRAGHTVSILPEFAADSEEAFFRLRANLQTREIEVIEAQEEISVAWFVSAGQVSDALTWPKFTRGLDTRYTAPRTPPDNTDGVVTVWMVAQDQRGGTAWHSIHLRVVPDPTQ